MRIWKPITGLIAALLLATALHAQTITLPAEAKVTVGRSTPLVVTSTGKTTTYDVLGDADVFREFDPDTSKIRLRVTLYSDSTAWLIVASADDKGNVAIAKCKVTSSAPVPPTPPVPPGPGPGPTPGPGPFDAKPFGAVSGLHVLIVFDDAAKNTLPDAQKSIIYSTLPGSVRAWLNANTPTGPDGKTHCWRVWEKGQDPTGDDPGWDKAMKYTLDHAKSYPWLVCQGPGGWYSGPLPADATKTQAGLAKFKQP